ncbi:MAG: AsmA protein, partial [Gammaproteobacteria bacterium]|nr:AsmA protein [Gammaproteobacteria bacterium]
DAAEAVRIAKWTSIIVAGVLLLLVAAAFVLTSVVDPNRYRGKIEGIVADLAGRPFVIEGNLEITWYPWLGVRTGAAHLDNLPGVPGPPSVEWQSIAVAAKVLPLLKGEIVADRIRLQSPHIHLRRDAQGHGNWEDLGPRKPVTAPAPQPPAPSKPLQIAGIEIRNGTIDYVDEASGLQANLSSLELDIGEWRAGQPLPVHTRFLAHTQSLPPAGLWVQVDAPQLALRTDPLNLKAPKLTVQVANTRIDGDDVTYDQTADAHIHARGSLALHSPSVRQLANDLALNQTLPHDPTTLGPLELTTTWTYDDGSIAAKPLALKLDGVSFNGWLERTAAPRAMWGFELHGDRIDLGRYVNVDSTNKKPFELPVAALRAINANGSVIFDQVVLADTHMSDVHLKLQTPEGKP